VIADAGADAVAGGSALEAVLAGSDAADDAPGAAAIPGIALPGPVDAVARVLVGVDATGDWTRGDGTTISRFGRCTGVTEAAPIGAADDAGAMVFSGVCLPLGGTAGNVGKAGAEACGGTGCTGTAGTTTGFSGDGGLACGKTVPLVEADALPGGGAAASIWGSDVLAEDAGKATEAGSAAFSGAGAGLLALLSSEGRLATTGVLETPRS